MLAGCPAAPDILLQVATCFTDANLRSWGQQPHARPFILMKKILVIDDEASFCGAVTVTLRRAGYEVHAAGDGADGLAQAFQHRPHLIVSDVHMTGMGGLELLAVRS